MGKTLPHDMGPYRLEEKLGVGGMGVVYRATDKALDRTVAIKMMHPAEQLGAGVDVKEVGARFLREAKAVARIKSRHVAQVLQLGENDDGDVYIVMELLKGVSLQKLMQKSGALPAARVIHIGLQICKGMQAAHDLGIVHRDLKPANVMIVEEDGDADFVKILDFGVAKLTHDVETQGLTQAGALLGTLPFMAPEQITTGPIDNRTDVYSLGVLLYRLFTGASIWDCDSLSDIVRHQLSSPPPSMFERLTRPTFTAELDGIVLRCLQKEPQRRFASMRDLGQALEQAGQRLPAKGGDDDEEEDNEDDRTTRLPQARRPGATLTDDAALTPGTGNSGGFFDPPASDHGDVFDSAPASPVAAGPTAEESPQTTAPTIPARRGPRPAMTPTSPASAAVAALTNDNDIVDEPGLVDATAPMVAARPPGSRNRRAALVGVGLLAAVVAVVVAATVGVSDADAKPHLTLPTTLPTTTTTTTTTTTAATTTTTAATTTMDPPLVTPPADAGVVAAGGEDVGEDLRDAAVEVTVDAGQAGEKIGEVPARLPLKPVKPISKPVKLVKPDGVPVKPVDPPKPSFVRVRTKETPGTP